jgi:membrane-bound metal-dependent hydrolase YbcI (DUF457 family)
VTGNSHVTVGVMTYAALWALPLGPVRLPGSYAVSPIPGAPPIGPVSAAIGPFGVPLLADVHSFPGLLIALLLVGFGALLPDVDHPEGRLVNSRFFGIEFFQIFPWLLASIAFIYKLLTLPVTVVFKIAGIRLRGHGFRANFGHRGITHSLLALGSLVALGELPLFPWHWLHLGLLIGWGYASHLLADALTKQGVPLLWPLDRRFGFPPFRPLRLTTGTFTEYALVAALTVLCLINIARAFP